jgi:hypothetical protein
VLIGLYNFQACSFCHSNAATIDPENCVFQIQLLQVWLALEEKQIPYDCVLIELYNKPEWYKELVPTSLVPAVVSGCLVRFNHARSAAANSSNCVQLSTRFST